MTADTMRVFIFGAGYSARAAGKLLAARGAQVAGTTRSPDKADLLRQNSIRPFIFNEQAPIDAIKDELAETTHLIQSVAPDAQGDPVLRDLGDAILRHMPKLEWIGYLSTVGVYGDHNGAWIDETAATNPRPGRSTERVAAERAWLDIGARTARPVALLRLSGIYGPGRNAFVNLQNGTAKRLIKPDQVFNRIYVDDIAGAVAHLAELRAGGAYNVTDDEPAPPQDVVEYAARLMDVAPPPPTDFATAQLSPMARSFYEENKRVSNARLKAGGYSFQYPTYQSAFDAMWRAGNWADGAARSPMRKD